MIIYVLFCRLQRLWNEEVQKKGMDKASLIGVVLVFLRTRLLANLILLLMLVTASFLGPVELYLHSFCKFSKNLIEMGFFVLVQKGNNLYRKPLHTKTCLNVFHFGRVLS